MRLAFVFPGQGAQYVGMGKSLAAASEKASETLAEADDVLGFGLRRLMFEGPESELRLTFNTQPAILAVSVAALRALWDLCGVRPDMAAGHSLGEYSALVAAGVVSYRDALNLVRQRGRLMDEAVPAGGGAMAAVLGADPESLGRLCAEVSEQSGEPVELANLNCPGQIVVSGAAAAVDELIRRAQGSVARRAVRLEVSGPFHSSLMSEAGKRLRGILAQVPMSPPEFPVVSNADAVPAESLPKIQDALARQVASPVLWEASVREMGLRGVGVYVEIGPGSVLSGLIRKTDPRARTLRVEDSVSLVETAAELCRKDVGE